MKRTALILLLSTSAISAHTTARSVTFSETIAPIVFERCAGCHRADGVAPFALTSYKDAAQHARKIAEVTRTRTMPPWHAESGSYPFKYDRRLTSDQIALIQQWVRDGAPE